jgi:hypothetical protein
MYVRRRYPMSTKLTLRLEDKLVKDAKKVARSKGVSLSRMVADYFKSIESQRKGQRVESPVLTEISGILLTRADARKLLADYKKHIEEKYR